MFQPRFQISQVLSEFLTEIAVFREKIVSAKVLPKREIFLSNKARLRMIHSSTAIEGNPLDLREVEQILAGKMVSGIKEKDRLEVINYQKVLDFIDKKAKLDKFDWEKSILKIHRLITKGMLANSESGFYRQGPVFVIQRPENKLVYKAPEAKLATKMMTEFCQWLNNNEQTELSPVIMAGIGHHQLVTIHPFTDGNGRTARALATLILYRKNYDIRKLFALEDYYNLDRQRYYQAIAGARKNKDLTSWLEFFCQGFLYELDQVWEQIEEFSFGLKEEKKQVYLSKRQRRILDFIMVNGRIYRSDVVDIGTVSEKTAYRELEFLRQEGFIRRKGQGPSTHYVLEKD